MTDTQDEKNIDIYCPICNVQVEARIIANNVSSEILDGGMMSEPADATYNVTVTSFAECKRCKQPFLLQEYYTEVPGEFSLPTDEMRQLYPQERNIPIDEVPVSVSRPYNMAAHSYRVQLYEPCVIMCRKCIEAICIEHNIKKGSLKNRLSTLHKNGIIDHTLYSWADELRMIGNDAAHDINIDIKKEDAQDALEFSEAILLYVFVYRNRFKKFQARRNKTDVRGIDQ